MTNFAQVPLRWVGPIHIIGSEVNEEISVPLATYESPLWPSVGRGAKLTRLCGGLRVSVINECMTRSVVLEGDNAGRMLEVAQDLQLRLTTLQQIVSKKSRYAELMDINFQIVGRLLYLRFEFLTGDASGHNMVTQASDDLMAWIREVYSDLKYVSISGNYCVDKKVSAVNSILGRGKNVVAELVIPRAICEKHLRTTPEALVDLNTKKNLLGSIVAGSLRSANAHFANMLLAFYIATGQDAANIVEGSQGITYIEVVDGGVYISITLPNIIVGSVGNGKGLAFVEEHLKKLGCKQTLPAGSNARRLAILAAATCFCGELSLLAAQTNPGELMQSHIAMERRGK